MLNQKKAEIRHEPVLSSEVFEALHFKNRGRYIDATLGLGGYARKILEKGGILLGIEVDPEMLNEARPILEKFLEDHKLELAKGNYKDIDKIASNEGFDKVDGIIFDLGVSNLQLTSFERGFSFRNKLAYLDMRLDPCSQEISASDLLNILRKDQLVGIFSKTMWFSDARKLVERILNFRRNKKFTYVGDLLEVISFLKGKGKLHPATKAFLALRIAVNSELDNLKEALPKAFNLLRRKGRLVVISFHSLEDKIVKDYYKKKEKENQGRRINKKPIRATKREVDKNPSARSAKLRILEKI